MYPIHRTRRLSVTVAAVAAAALALPACQGAATAASHRPHHYAAHAAAQQTQNGLTVTDLKDLANTKRDLFQRLAQQTQGGLTITDLKDLAEVKRGPLPQIGGTPPSQQAPITSREGVHPAGRLHPAARARTGVMRSEDRESLFNK